MYRSNRLVALKTLLPQPFWCIALLLVFSTAQQAPAKPPTPSFNGAAALAATQKAVSFGERPSGSEAIVHLRDWIVAQMKPLGGELILDSFTGQTPSGPVPMTNLIFKFHGTSGKAIVVTGHYDTKRIPMVHFVGANDAGSSTGFLIELARVVSKMNHADDIYIVFFDGEEDVVSWTATDSLYGSRHLAAKWASEGMLARIKALINIDMIGDKELGVFNDDSSSGSLRKMTWQIAAKRDDSKYFRNDVTAIDDDHKPFVDSGVNAMDIIAAVGPPSNSATLGAYWHTAQDTMDKLSAHSFQVVGDVIVDLIKELGQG